jgi:hypothetical protein
MRDGFEVYERQVINLFQEVGATGADGTEVVMGDTATFPENSAEIINGLMQQHQIQPGSKVSGATIENLAWKAFLQITADLEKEYQRAIRALGTVPAKDAAGGKAVRENVNYVNRERKAYRTQFIKAIQEYIQGRLQAAMPGQMAGGQMAGATQ